MTFSLHRVLNLSGIVLVVSAVGYVLVFVVGGQVFSLFERAPTVVLWLLGLTWPFLFFGPAVVLTLLWAGWVRQAQRPRWQAYVFGLLASVSWFACLPLVTQVISPSEQGFSWYQVGVVASLYPLAGMMLLVGLTLAIDWWVHRPAKLAVDKAKGER